MASFDIVSFSFNKEEILGIAICNIEEKYIVYADYTIYIVDNLRKTASVLLDNVIIPACDEALFDYKLNTYIKNTDSNNKEG